MKTKKTKWRSLLLLLAAWVARAFIWVIITVLVLVVASVMVAELISLAKKELGPAPGNQTTVTNYYHGTNYSSPSDVVITSTNGLEVQYGVDTNLNAWVSLACTNQPAVDWRSPGTFRILSDDTNSYEYFFSDFSVLNHVLYTASNDYLGGWNATSVLERSADLVHWQDVQTDALTIVGAVNAYYDTNKEPAEFYRLRFQ